MKRSILVIALLSLAVLPAFLFADVTMKSISRSGGYQGMGANEGAVTRVVQGIKSHEDSQFKFTGKMMKFMTGGDKGGTQIIRVDLDKIWRLDLKEEKTYSEMTISTMMEKMKQPPRAEEPKSKAGAPQEEEKPTHRVKKTEFSVKKTGAKKAINGFSTEETRASMLVEIEEIATGEVTSFLMLTKFWFTPWTADLKKATDEEMKFSKAYLAKMGLTFSPKDRETFGGAGLGMMLGLGDKKTAELLNQLKEKTKDLNGYPIVTESDWTMKEDPKVAARRKEAEAKAAQAESEAGDSPELSSDPKNMAGHMLGVFAKKKMKQHQETQAKEQEGKPSFSAYHEVISISVSPAEASLFEIPAGFKKVE